MAKATSTGGSGSRGGGAARTSSDPDRRGFDAIVQILNGRSPRSEVAGTSPGRGGLAAQIRADRYYAAHLLGDLKDPRGVDHLIPLINDKDLDAIIPWSLAQIGDRRAIPSLLQMLERREPSIPVLSISALEQLNATEALPRLRELLQDERPTNLRDPITVSQAAKHAIAVISSASRRENR